MESTSDLMNHYSRTMCAGDRRRCRARPVPLVMSVPGPAVSGGLPAGRPGFRACTADAPPTSAEHGGAGARN